MILDKIISHKKEEVAESKRQRPLAALTEALKTAAPTRNFREAITTGNCAIIAEVKHKSPSRGILRSDFDPSAIAACYEQNGAAAVSVLTDNRFFGGELSYLTGIKAITELPLLRKDFIIDPYQIYETRAHGGDALLLIAAVLGKAELADLLSLTQELQLAALVEVHTASEIEKALASGAEIIGINNRDLNTFETSLQTSIELAPLLSADITVVSESGIHSRKDIETLTEKGIHTFLIGEALMQADDSGRKLRELRGVQAE